jgi:hypothetical protein
MAASSSAWEPWVGDLGENEEGGGAWGAYLFHPDEDRELSLAARSGDEVAAAAVHVIGLVPNRVQAAPRKDPSRCMCCQRSIRRGHRYAVAAIMPEGPDPSGSIGAPVCMLCVGDEAALKDRISAAMRVLAPAAHQLPDEASPHAAGHA